MVSTGKLKQALNKSNWQTSHELVRIAIQNANPGWAITGWAYPRDKLND